MDKVLITGVCGFVGQHMISYLSGKDEIEVLGIDKKSKFEHFTGEEPDLEFESVDLNDSESVREILEEFKPTIIIHLAALSSVGKSWKEPSKTFEKNTALLLNILETLRLSKIKSRLLSVGSSEEYGIADKSELPLIENRRVKPSNPYAVSSVAKQNLSDVYVRGYGIDIVKTRSFNHLGPGQASNFFIPSIARQLAKIKNGDHKPSKLVVGDLSIVRDFIDVRDVVRAYWALINRGKKGVTYNVCSGKGVKLRKIVNTLIELTGQKVEIEVDESKLRPIDNPIIIGSNEKIFNEVGWKPEVSLRKSLQDTLTYYLKTVEK